MGLLKSACALVGIRREPTLQEYTSAMHLLQEHAAKKNLHETATKFRQQKEELSGVWRASLNQAQSLKALRDFEAEFAPALKQAQRTVDRASAFVKAMYEQGFTQVTPGVYNGPYPK